MRNRSKGWAEEADSHNRKRRAELESKGVYVPECTILERNVCVDACMYEGQEATRPLFLADSSPSQT